MVSPAEHAEEKRRRQREAYMVGVFGVTGLGKMKMIERRAEWERRHGVFEDDEYKEREDA
jgi:hypothetical protein